MNIVLHVTAALLAALLLAAGDPRAVCWRRHLRPPSGPGGIAWPGSASEEHPFGHFLLGRRLAYLRFDETRRRLHYGAALVLFVAALLCKTVTGTLPGALLVILWWQRGRLSWSKDVLPLAPWFVLGTAGRRGHGLVELEINACRGGRVQPCRDGADPDCGQGRLVLSGKAPLAGPLDLQLSALADQPICLVAVLLSAGAAALVGGVVERAATDPRAAGGTAVLLSEPSCRCWGSSTFTRSGTRSSPITISTWPAWRIIALVAAAATSLLDRADSATKGGGPHGVPGPVGRLAVLSWRQCRMYADAETLYRTTIDANPDCWMAHSNLGFVLAGRGQLEEAIAHYGKALEIEPDFAETQYNLGAALAGRGQIDEAIAHYQRALQIKPDHVLAHNNLGAALAGRGQIDEAIAITGRPWKSNPTAEAHNNLGTALVGRGQVDEAIDHYRKALEIQPEFVEAHYNLGLALAGCGQVDEAIAHYQKAVEIKPDYLVAHHKLGNVLFDRGRLDEAIASYQKVLDIKPEHAGAHNNLGLALAGRGQVDEAITHYRKALEINSDYLEAHYNLGLALAGRGRRDEALEHYDKALRLASARNNEALADIIQCANYDYLRSHCDLPSRIRLLCRENRSQTHPRPTAICGLRRASDRRGPTAADRGRPAWSGEVKDWAFAAALLLAVLLTYQPAWHGGFVWDDDEALVPRPELRSWHGLYRIWFDVLATEQYYPLSFSAFWVEHKLWGDATLGYHLVNIFLHATAALLVMLILRRLAVPGAYLAAAIFALHPVHVESVAWITELKNTLSGVFYLGAMLLYLHFDQTRKARWYLACLGVVRARPAEQDRHRDAAGGAAGDLLVAAGTVVVEKGPAAAGALLPRRRHGRSDDRLGRAQ